MNTISSGNNRMMCNMSADCMMCIFSCTYISRTSKRKLSM